MEMTSPGWKGAEYRPLQEHLLQGSILDEQRESLLHRLNGLCDMMQASPEKFHDHEMVYQLRAGSGATQSVNLRVRRALDQKDAPWHVRYVGLDIGEKSKHTVVHNCIDVGTTDNVVTFLTDMGFRLDHEYVLTGYLFKKGRMKVTVSKLYKMLQANNTDKVEPLSSSCLVELSVVSPHSTDQIQEDMKNFAEQLKPLVQLEKVDYRRLQQQAGM